MLYNKQQEIIDEIFSMIDEQHGACNEYCHHKTCSDCDDIYGLVVNILDYLYNIGVLKEKIEP